MEDKNINEINMEELDQVSGGTAMFRSGNLKPRIVRTMTESEKFDLFNSAMELRLMGYDLDSAAIRLKDTCGAATDEEYRTKLNYLRDIWPQVVSDVNNQRGT